MIGYRLPDGCSDADYDLEFGETPIEIIYRYWDNEINDESKVLKHLSEIDFEKKFIKEASYLVDYDFVLELLSDYEIEDYILLLAEYIFIQDCVGLPEHLCYKIFKLKEVLDEYIIYRWENKETKPKHQNCDYEEFIEIIRNIQRQLLQKFKRE